MKISRRLAAVLLSPLGLLILAGGLIPAGVLFAYSFYDYSLFQVTPAFQLGWYRGIVSESLYRTVAWNTVAFELEEAARDLGAGKAQALRRVIMPLSGGAILGAGALCFFLSAGDYVTPAFLGGVTTSQTFGTTISTAISTEGNYPLGSALS